MSAGAWATRAAGGLAIAIAAWWAFRPLGRPDLTLPQPPEAPVNANEPTTLVALDDSAFHAPLWVAPPPPPAAPAESKPTPLPPLKLQLLAIVRQGEGAESGGEYKALLYDPDTDKIIEVAAGQTIGDRTVTGITQRELTLKDGAGTRTLSLRSDVSGGGGGS